MAKDVKIYEAAKLRFKRQYEQENPKPEKPSHKNFWTDFQVLYTLFIALASFLLSALRTYKVFEHVGSGVEGVLGVIVVEGVALGIPFFLVLRHYKEYTGDAPYKPGQLRGWMYVLVFFSVGIGLGANIYEAVGADAWVPDIVNYGFLVFVGAIATVTVATLGHILGVLWVQNLVDYEYFLDVYERDFQTWTDTMNESWKYNQNKWYKMTETSIPAQTDSRQTQAIATHSAIQPQQTAFSQASLDMSTDRQQTRPMGFTQTAQPTPNRQVGAVEMVIQHLNENPQDANLSGRRLGKIVGVGKDSAYKALSEWQGE